jgi:hypothetical protein
VKRVACGISSSIISSSSSSRSSSSGGSSVGSRDRSSSDRTPGSVDVVFERQGRLGVVVIRNIAPINLTFFLVFPETISYTLFVSIDLFLEDEEGYFFTDKKEKSIIEICCGDCVDDGLLLDFEWN